MTDVQQARIEAAAKAMWEAGDPREPGWPDLPHGVRQGYRREALAALAAGDAVVTVDQIERAIMGRTATAGAKAVQRLYRGEEQS